MHRSKDRNPFLKHASTFEPHFRNRQSKGENYDGDHFHMKQNLNPYQICVGKDLVSLSQVQSAAHWAERSRPTSLPSLPHKHQHVSVLPQDNHYIQSHSQDTINTNT